MTWELSAGLFFAAFLATFGMTKVVLVELRRRALLDIPNDRSSHNVPTPRGGGLAVLLVFLVALVCLSGFGEVSQPRAIGVLGLTLVLGILSWIDDLHGLGPFLRLAGHGGAVVVAMWLGLIKGPVFGGLLPPVLDSVAAGFVWVWFINLFNFMDGIDGIAGVEAVSVGIGVALLTMFSGIESETGYISLALAGAAAGFLVWNWHPAKIFLGDVGSIPMGFVLGGVLLSVAAEGYWAAALILPAYFLADATFSLLKRLVRGEKVWQAHREHFYQYAVQNGKSHAEVSAAVGLANGVLIVSALLVLSEYRYWAAGAAIGVVGVLIFWMRRPSGIRSTEEPEK